jgi:thioredoxin/glutathione reductase (selenoprotein)
MADSKMADEYDYDLIVIGGGSGGLAASKQAAELGAKVAVFDFVTPTPTGSKWGLGGTCVNVGCIPKKIMHYTALLGAAFHDAKSLGWKVQDHNEHDWEKMVEAAQDHILGLNFGYRTQLRQAKINYINAYASFVDPQTVEYHDKKGTRFTLRARNFVIAVGGRPQYDLSVANIKELAITSDDIFSKKTAPGKTLVVGASYIALETAGFLKELGYETAVMVRSVLLRGFDRECADKIGSYMENVGVRFIRSAIPQRLDKNEDGSIKVTYVDSSSNQTLTENFNTVVFAIGRYALTEGLKLENCGVKVHPNSKKIIADDEQSNVEHIYAIGDVIHGKPELTPVAIQAGRLLAKRLYGGSTVKMDYNLVPTTVFTPVEYGACGFSEEEAHDRYGPDNIDVYISEFNSLEMAAAHRKTVSGDDLENPVFAKLIVHMPDNNRVVGFHYVGPNAGEVTQGYALALRLGATKDDFDSVIGIHPTCAEEFTTLSVTKRSGADAAKGGC